MRKNTTGRLRISHAPFAGDTHYYYFLVFRSTRPVWPRRRSITCQNMLFEKFTTRTHRALRRIITWCDRHNDCLLSDSLFIVWHHQWIVISLIAIFSTQTSFTAGKSCRLKTTTTHDRFFHEHQQFAIQPHTALPRSRIYVVAHPPPTFALTQPSANQRYHNPLPSINGLIA